MRKEFICDNNLKGLRGRWTFRLNGLEPLVPRKFGWIQLLLSLMYVAMTILETRQKLIFLRLTFLTPLFILGLDEPLRSAMLITCVMDDIFKFGFVALKYLHD